jgi:hypothetical protein
VRLEKTQKAADSLQDMIFLPTRGLHLFPLSSVVDTVSGGMYNYQRANESLFPANAALLYRHAGCKTMPMRSKHDAERFVVCVPPHSHSLARQGRGQADAGDVFSGGIAL